MQDIPDILDGLRRSINILSAFVTALPEDKLNRRRGAGFWTVAEHVSHLAQVQPLLLERLQRFLAEDRPEFVPYVPGDGEEEDRPPEMEMKAALAEFARCRQQQLALLERADDGDWQKSAIHPEYDIYTLYILTRHILMHDHWHLYRMEQIWLTRDEFLD
jgi:DinB superfamily